MSRGLRVEPDAAIFVSDQTARPPFRVLCLDGGGMRGLYTAAYLCCVSEGFSKKRGVGELDLGLGFNLIAGTSTGAISFVRRDATTIASVSPNQAQYARGGRAAIRQIHRR